MHDSDSFISEVSEEVRRDKLYATLRRYGWLITALVVLIVGGAAVNEWRKVRHAAQAEAAGDASARPMPRPTRRRARPRSAISPHRRRGRRCWRSWPRPARRPRRATPGAAALLGELAGDGSAGELYRSLAALQRVMLLGPAMDASERQATLELLVNPGAPFRPLALEQRALMHLDAGDKAAAIADLQALLTEPRPARRCAAGRGSSSSPRADRCPHRRPSRPTAEARRWFGTPRASPWRVLLALAGCDRGDPILPGERIPVRPDDAPVAGGARQALGVPPPS